MPYMNDLTAGHQAHAAYRHTRFNPNRFRPVHDGWRSEMTMKDTLAFDRSLNGNHTPACALPTRGGVCDCWPMPTDSPPWGQLGHAAGQGPVEDDINAGKVVSGI